MTVKQHTLFNTNGAAISEGRDYRYALWRAWNPELPMVMFIGLNPSTADENLDDATLRRCIKFAKSWGYGGLYMMNLFAFRTKSPKELKKAEHPIGEPERSETDSWLQYASTLTDKIIFCWGQGGTYLKRDREVIKMFPEAFYIEMTKVKGIPSHPLYLPKYLKPKPYTTETEHTPRVAPGEQLKLL